MITETIKYKNYKLRGISIFYAKRKNFDSQVIRVHFEELDGLSFFIDCDSGDWRSELVHVSDCTTMSEEEFFQYSVMWEYEIPVELVREVQTIGVRFTQMDPDTYDKEVHVIEVQY